MLSMRKSPWTMLVRVCSGTVRGSHSISRSTSGSSSVWLIRYCFDQRSTCRAK